MVGAQIAVAEGLHTVTIYLVETMQTIVATSKLAREQHDVAHLQRLCLDSH